jgi:hypothetical protein
MRAVTLILIAVIASLLAAAAPAGAQGLALPGQCFREGERVAMTGTGFPSGQLIVMNWRTESSVTLDAPGPSYADASGAFVEEVAMPPVDERDLVENEIIAWIENTAVTARFQVAAAGQVTASPRLGRPGRRSRFRAAGFPVGGRLYAHYLRRGRLVRTVELGPLAGPCGTLDVRRRGVPGRDPRRGLWRVQFDASPAWSPQTQPRDTMAFRVR